jgi:hypothetical protein
MERLLTIYEQHRGAVRQKGNLSPNYQISNLNRGKKGVGGMFSQHFDFYLDELSDHCRIALDAVGELNYSLLNLQRMTCGSERYHFFHNAIFHSIYVFLIHTRAISRMLWPDTTAKSVDNHYYQHAKNAMTIAIKRKLGPNSRKSLHHCQLEAIIDQFIDQREKPGIKVYYDRNIIGPCLDYTQPYNPEMSASCAYDPISRSFHVCGELIQIDDLTAAIYKLQTCIDRELEAKFSPAEGRPLQAMQMIH